VTRRRPYFGYYVVAALFLAEIAVTGVSFYSFSLFIRAWQADDSLGWSLTQINAAFIVGLPLAFASPLLGRLVDTRGPKIVMLVGVPMIALSFALRAFMTEIWHLWALQGLLVLGQSAAFLGTGKLVGLWFQRDRGRIMGIALAGNNMGGLTMAPLSAYLLTVMDWRLMFVIFGVGLLVVNTLVIVFLVRDKPQDVIAEARRVGRDAEAEEAERLMALGARMGQAFAGRAPTADVPETTDVTRWQEAMRTPAFWFIAATFMAAFTSIFAVLNQLAKHLEILGIDIQTAGTALALLGFFGLIGKVLFGFISERIPVRYAFAIVSALQVGGILILLLVRSNDDVWILWPFVAMYGVGFGAVGALMPLMIADTFGITAYGTIFGVMQMLLRIGSAGLPVVVGFSVDWTGEYTLAFITTIGVLILGTAASMFAKRPTPGTLRLDRSGADD
jgi:sugar phosphate permease